MSLLEILLIAFVVFAVTFLTGEWLANGAAPWFRKSSKQQIADSEISRRES